MEPIQIKKRLSTIYPKRTSVAFTLLIALLSLCCAGFAQGKQTKKELENKKNKLRNEINNINELLAETKNNKKISMNQVAIINKKINVREELIQTINTEIKALNQSINTNQKEVDELKANLAKLKSDYGKMIYYAYRNKDTYNRMMFVFASGNFNQAFQRLRYIQQYNENMKKQADFIVKTQEEINLKIAELEQRKNEKKQLLTSEEQEKLNLNKEKTDQEVMLAQLQDKEKQLKEELEQKKKDAEALNAAIKKLIAEEIKRAKDKEIADAKAKKKNTTSGKENKETSKAAPNPELTKEAELLSSDFASNKGQLPWPVLKGVITDGFGEHEHPSIKGFMVNNNGIDISTNKGGSCRAVFEGEVTGVASVTGSGKIVIIRHGEYLSVYSNLSDVTVKTGDKVTLKQNIGTIAYNSSEEKTVMNFQIWKGQKILNPEDWIFR